jgi:hypothetical protein
MCLYILEIHQLELQHLQSFHIHRHLRIHLSHLEYFHHILHHRPLSLYIQIQMSCHHCFLLHLHYILLRYLPLQPQQQHYMFLM